MQKKFLTNLGFLVLINLLVKPFYILGIDAEVQNVVGAEDYGTYFAILNFTFLFNIISDLGITNFNNRNIAQNSTLLEEHLPKIITLRMLLLVLFAVVTIAAGFLIGYSRNQAYLLLFLTLNQGLISSIYYMRSNLSGLQLFRQDSIISVMDRVLLIIICGVLLWGSWTDGAFQIEWFVYAQTIAYALTLLCAFILVRMNISSFRLRFDGVFSKDIIKQSIPFAILILVLSLYHKMDSVILERLLGDGGKQAGIYAQGFRFLDALNNFSFLFPILLFPIFSRMLKEKEDIKELLDMVTRLLISGVIVIAITCYSFSLDIIDWRYTDNIHPASQCFSLLILTAICHSVVHIFGTLLTSAGKLTRLNILGAAAVVLSLILNLTLIPKYLAFGSAIASLMSQTVVAVSHILIVQSLFGFSMRLSVVLRLIFLGVLMFGIGHFAHFLPWNWMINALAMLLLGLASAFALKLMEFKQLMHILNPLETR